MLDLGPELPKIPIENESDVFHEMAGHLNMPDITGMVGRVIIVVLHDSSGVVVVHEALATLLVEASIIE